MDALTALPGVGRKTANVVLGHALGVPGLPVDRHVLRVANRIGLAEGDDPVEVESQLCARDASRAVDPHLRRADPARPPRVPAEAANASAARCRPTTAPTTRRRSTARAQARPKARPKARKGAPTVTRAAFERLVTEAVMLIPLRFRREIGNLALVVEDEPSHGAAGDDGDRAAGLAVRPLRRHAADRARSGPTATRCPDRITIFQRPIEEDCEDEEEVRAVIGETLIHEVGHYFGMSEDEIEAIEEQYWRGDTLGPDDDEP